MVKQKEEIEVIIEKFKVARNHKLSHNELAVYDVYLALDAYQKSHYSMRVGFSQEQISEWCNIDHSTVKRTVKKLKEKGLIKKNTYDNGFSVKDIYQ